MAGSAGRYMSMANGPLADRSPSVTAFRKNLVSIMEGSSRAEVRRRGFTKRRRAAGYKGDGVAEVGPIAGSGGDFAVLQGLHSVALLYAVSVAPASAERGRGLPDAPGSEPLGCALVVRARRAAP
jgi:hypothetical protein